MTTKDVADIVQALRAVCERTTAQPESADRLLADPTGVIEAALGRKLPEGVAFTAMHNATTDSITLVPMVIEGTELPDEALELVTGSSTDSRGKRCVVQSIRL